MATVAITRNGPETLSRSEMQQALRFSMKVAGEAHHKHITPLKFKRSAHRRYKHEPRNFKYLSDKLKKKRASDGTRATGEGLDFVWGGETRARALASTKVVARAPSSRRGHAEVFIQAEQLNRARLGGSGEIARVEFERTHPDDADLVGSLAETGYAQFLNRRSAGRRKTKTFKG